MDSIPKKEGTGREGKMNFKISQRFLLLFRNRDFWQDFSEMVAGEKSIAQLLQAASASPGGRDARFTPFLEKWQLDIGDFFDASELSGKTKEGRDIERYFLDVVGIKDSRGKKKKFKDERFKEMLRVFDLHEGWVAPRGWKGKEYPRLNFTRIASDLNPGRCFSREDKKREAGRVREIYYFTFKEIYGYAYDPQRAKKIRMADHFVKNMCQTCTNKVCGPLGKKKPKKSDNKDTEEETLQESDGEEFKKERSQKLNADQIEKKLNFNYGCEKLGRSLPFFAYKAYVNQARSLEDNESIIEIEKDLLQGRGRDISRPPLEYVEKKQLVTSQLKLGSEATPEELLQGFQKKLDQMDGDEKEEPGGHHEL
jgi:hypothetical protein